MEGEARRYARTHEWILMEDGQAAVGISEYAVQELGDIVYLELPESGRTVKAGESLGEIESVKAVSDFYAPVSGEVLEVNPALQDKPELINESPLTDGWIVKLQIENPDELESLMTREAYDAFVAEQT
ncbi:MAG TPA: glycine cleavage system protein GcvH [Chloroflexota bacterium]|nr:glycine cleavage system protein GcvH [Chloroflexota bacterium]